MFRYAFDESSFSLLLMERPSPLIHFDLSVNHNVFESALKRAVEEMGVSGIPEDTQASFLMTEPFQRTNWALDTIEQ